MLYTILLFKVTSWIYALVHIPPIIIIITSPPYKQKKGFYVLSTNILLMPRKARFQVIKKE